MSDLALEFCRSLDNGFAFVCEHLVLFTQCRDLLLKLLPLAVPLHRPSTVLLELKDIFYDSIALSTVLGCNGNVPDSSPGDPVFECQCTALEIDPLHKACVEEIYSSQLLKVYSACHPSAGR